MNTIIRANHSSALDRLAVEAREQADEIGALLASAELPEELAAKKNTAGDDK